MLNVLFPNSRIARINSHIFFWVTCLGAYTIVYGRMSNDYTGTFLHLIITLPIYLSATYFTLYVVIPNYVEKRKFKSVIIYIIYIILGSAFAELLVTFWLILNPSIKILGYSNIRLNTSSLDVFLRVIGIMLVITAASSIKLLKKWYQTQKRNQELQTEKLEAELNTLKSQLHPHFLFNTLNNLYALTLKNSSKSSEVVLRLSEMFSYILYECNDDYVFLNKEVELIQNYIFLESIRFDNQIDVKFEIKKDIENQKIAPLILFTFVENSFKHKSSLPNQKPWIDIALQTNNKTILFSIKNSNDKSSQKPTNNSGIGLNNVKKRLKLVYGSNYDLQITDAENIFKVNLILYS